LYGDEQGFYLHDSTAENYIYGRQPMTSSEAWQLHGCYTGRASYQFKNMPFTSQSRNGCQDNLQSLDHFNQSHPSFLFTQQLNWLYSSYSIFTNAFRLETLMEQKLNDINGNPNGQSLWSVSRSFQYFQTRSANV
jgi:alpha-1,3-glucan synthase